MRTSQNSCNHLFLVDSGDYKPPHDVSRDVKSFDDVLNRGALDLARRAALRRAEACQRRVEILELEVKTLRESIAREARRYEVERFLLEKQNSDFANEISAIKRKNARCVAALTEIVSNIGPERTIAELMSLLRKSDR